VENDRPPSFQGAADGGDSSAFLAPHTFDYKTSPLWASEGTPKAGSLTNFTISILYDETWMTRSGAEEDGNYCSHKDSRLLKKDIELFPTIWEELGD
jgi:hypothetical protein